jgi:hypothetical protein
MTFWQKTSIGIFCLGLWLVGPVNAQEDVSLQLNLKGETAAEPAPTLSFGEFGISLGSQVMEASTSESRIQFSRFLNREEDFTLRTGTTTSSNPGPVFAIGQEPHNSTFSRQESRDFGSLTLTATYLQDQFGRTSPTPATVGAARRLGRWAIYGEFSNKSRPDSPTPPPIVQPAAIQPEILMNRAPLAPEVAQPTVSTTPSADSSEIPTAQNYYLEATYNFKPSVKGKVSYKRSHIDALEGNENLQVEGIVDTGSNMQIKAGYRNKTNPDYRDQKPANDTKVWTEFILKF